MSRSQRDKGNRVEREIVNALKESGINAARVPMSGASRSGLLPESDIVIHEVMGDRDLVAEVKARKEGAGFATLERWKGNNDVLFLKRDRKEPMVVIDFTLFIDLVKHRGSL